MYCHSFDISIQHISIQHISTQHSKRWQEIVHYLTGILAAAAAMKSVSWFGVSVAKLMAICIAISSGKYFITNKYQQLVKR